MSAKTADYLVAMHFNCVTKIKCWPQPSTSFSHSLPDLMLIPPGLWASMFFQFSPQTGFRSRLYDCHSNTFTRLSL